MPHDILTQYSSLFKVSIFINEAHKSCEGLIIRSPLQPQELHKSNEYRNVLKTMRTDKSITRAVTRSVI